MIETKNKKILKTILQIVLIVIVLIPKQELATSKVKLGDINGDGQITQTDMLLVLRHISAANNKNHEKWILTGDKLKAADITENNIIDTSDALELMRYIAASYSSEIAKKHPEWIKLNEKETDSTIEPEQKSEPKTTVVEVKSIKLDKTKIKLDMSGTKTATITATIEPSNVTNKEVTWTSSNTKVATVDKTGKVSAKANGTAQITAETKANGKKATCNVTVITSPTSIKLNKSSISLELNGTKTTSIKATINPSNVTNKEVTWTSSNTKIATVDKNGKVTAKNTGTVTITAKSNNKKTATCKVTVKRRYWEVKNGKYIYYYLNGTTKTWTISEYVGWKKLTEKKVKSLNPATFKRNGNMFTFAGITHKYYAEDNTANNMAIKNGGSQYAITVDLDRRHESIFKINKGIWEPYKSEAVHVGKKWTRYNSKGCPDLKTYTKNSVTPTGLYYTSGNNNNGKGLYWVAFGVQYKNKNLGAYGVNGHGPNKEDYLHSGGANNYTVKKGGPCTNGCVVSSLKHAKWIYYNCGRGTPVLIY